MPSLSTADNRSHQGIGRRLLKTFLAAGLVINCLSNAVLASEDAAVENIPANRMFPDSTQALLSLPDTPNFLELLNNTQLGKLAAFDKLAPFWDSQRQELQERFSEAGWQMNLQVDDLEHVSAGQTSVGWIAREGEKAYSIALVVDVRDRVEEAERVLKRVADQLKSRDAKGATWEYAQAKIQEYRLPSPADENRMIESHYALHQGQLIVTDDKQTMQELLDAQSGDKENSLANSELYKNAQSKIETDGPAEIEYFVRPLGIAKLFRAIGSKPQKNQQDLIKLVEDQGFGAIECAIGHIHLGAEEFDFFHHGYVTLKKPVKRAVEILDFPNVEELQPPLWLNKDSSTVIAYSWNLQEAFGKFETIVDAYLDPDRPGTFNEILEGIRDDIQGPQIDIAKEILPFISSEFYVATEIAKPITPESKRSVVLLKLNDPDQKLNRVMDRYGRNESNGTPLDYEGHRIWSFKNDEEVEIELDFGSSSFSSSSDDEDDDSDEPLLDHWAISIVDGYFVFGSDAELIKELIDRVLTQPTESEFLKQPDVARVAQVMEAVSGNSASSATQINRADLAFEMQYELFREGQLNASRSILATLLDRLLDPKTKNRDREQRLKGDKLPPFETIRPYLMPSGSVVRTEEDGWSIQSYVLKKEAAADQSSSDDSDK